MIEIDKNKQPEYQNILTNEALDFLEKICNKFEDTRQQILENRKRIQAVSYTHLTLPTR